MTASDKSFSYESFTGRGIDVASVRADDLDKLSLEYFSKKNTAKVLDLGCGAGGQALRMAVAGVCVLAVDAGDFKDIFENYRTKASLFSDKLAFVRGDIRNLPDLIVEREFSDIYMQRTLHYLTYIQALELLKYLYKVSTDRLYISVSGMASDIGNDYLGRTLSIESRFVSLDAKNAETFQIFEPVCLYSQAEFVSLLELAGWRVLRCWQSAFGNHKAICSH
ncbi:class I SAM-dependent methyltransferase [Candidatus Nomurabacteria bacterium]|nr:class I SAM-dependent methyltransferase [Candidatus Kaiserbacteria bacterium]MCB9814044.1 class I SAM-dependent methyltransferase [Candidatus Nomurabacteria bacterium]